MAAGFLGLGLAATDHSSPASASPCGVGSTNTLYSGALGQDGSSPANAYRISSAADLIRISNTTADWTGKYFLQTQDIDLNDCEWTPIGTDANKFTGNYNGAGFEILRFKIDLIDNNIFNSNTVGLFGVISGATIENLMLSGSIKSNGAYIGGLVGNIKNDSAIINSVKVEVSITSEDYGYAGGLVGYFEAGTIRNAAYIGSMSGTSDTAIGSLTGFTSLGRTVDSYARASMSGSSTFRGGMEGYADLNVSNVFSVTSGANGGVVGSNFTTGVSNDSFWDTGVGPASAKPDGSSVSGTAGKTTTELKDIATYTAASWKIVEGWEPFSAPNKIWGICAEGNDGYPFLLWEYNASTNPCAVTPTPGTDSGFSSPIVIPDAFGASRIIKQPTIRKASGDRPARLLGKSLNKDVLFVADSARLSPEARKSLRQAARLAMASDGKLAVTGFAAMTNRGSAYEKSVALKRARVVARFLRAQGFDDWIYFHGLSGRRGQAFEGDPRRVEIRILK
jgi:hypothetical protein